MADRRRFGRFVFLVAFLVCLAVPVCFGQEPQWWTQQKRECGLPASLAYNTWTSQGQPCPARERASNPTPSTPDNSAAERAERDRIAREAEQRRLAAEAEAKRLAAQVEFEKDRDEAASTLKGSTGKSTIRTGSGTDDLKGSRPNTAIKTDIPKPTQPPFRESDFFYALQTRKFEPLNDGGRPIDVSPNLGVHGLVGGTSWTYGYKWARKDCDKTCREELVKRICATGPKTQKCDETTLPFNATDYDMVVSMGSYQSFFADLATRVVFDGPTLGEFSKQHAEIFASLKDREFDTLDCHSNGAMICLAALRGGVIKRATVVRLFGPQINPAAARQWQELARTGKIKLEIYINNGDPVPGLSWKMPMTKPLARPSVIPAWTPAIASTLLALPEMARNAIKDSEIGSMDVDLAAYGFKVNRLKCSAHFNFDCHTMREYEGNLR
ncbi:MAG TPA: hypothetical protein VGO43_01505 [Pyrinomonadaceae bacterium]|jgi:hypothetical protein|nr:hypothetical protein [Pyrinomonadaceae bacterium]